MHYSLYMLVTSVQFWRFVHAPKCSICYAPL